MRVDDRKRAFATDAVLAIGLFALSIGSAMAFEGPEGVEIRPMDIWGIGLMALQTLTLVWRRNRPITVLVLTVGGFIVDRGLNYPSSWAFVGIALAIYTVGAQLPPKRSLLIGGLTIDIVLLWTAIGIWAYDIDPFALLSEIAVLGLPLLLGRESYHRQQRLIDLERRAIRAEHEREHQASEAVTRERVRIARELHDVVAHEITVMTIQSAGARRVLRNDPAQAQAAIESAEDAGHRALTEIRRLLGMLRTTDPRATDPQPGLASLEDLVTQMNAAGLPTKLTVVGEPQLLPLGVDLNAYRIVQESLTNTLKHGGPDVNATIKVEYGGSSLSLDVSDDGRGAAAWSDSITGHQGQGLVGMHERVALLDGTLVAGPRAGGGYRVSAQIPIPTP